MTFEIQLNKGLVAIVDDEDSDLRLFTKWYAMRHNRPPAKEKFVALSKRSAKGLGQLMHRVILSRMLDRPLHDREYVDHVNGDTLDNRRSNLRLATASQNSMNRRKGTNNTSGYKGVSFIKATGKWRASIRVKGRMKYLGEFDTPKAAYEAYCEIAREVHGEFFNPG